MGFIKCLRISDKKIAAIAPLLDIDTVKTVYEQDIKAEIKAFKNDTCDAKNFKDYKKIYYIPNMDTSKIFDFDEFLNSCDNLIILPSLDVSNGTSFQYAFSCNSLVFVPELNVSNGKNFQGTFLSCYNIEKIYELDLQKATDCQYMFGYCYKLKEIEKIKCDFLKSSIMEKMFQSNTNLETIIIEGTIKIDSNDLNLSDSEKLTVDSIMSFINAFEDNTDEETQYTVTFGATNLAKLTEDQIAIATNKNILLA